MKRLISTAYNSRTMSKQDDRGIFHFSYNLALEAEENNYPHKVGDDAMHYSQGRSSVPPKIALIN